MLTRDKTYDIRTNFSSSPIDASRVDYNRSLRLDSGAPTATRTWANLTNVLSAFAQMRFCMATFVSEVTSADPNLASTVKRVVDWFCASQTAFKIEYLELPKVAGSIQAVERINAQKVFDALRVSPVLRHGTHDRVIVFTTKQVTGQDFPNVFSSTEEDSQGQFTGQAIVTTKDVEKLTDGLPIEGYIVQQLISINLRWVVGQPMLHKNPPEDCLFYQRIDKTKILLAVKEMRLCDKCRARANKLDDKQWLSLKKLMNAVSQTVGAKDPRDEMGKLLTVRENTIFGLWAWRDRAKTLPQDLIDNWRRFRKGRTRYTLAGVLVIGGIAIIDPPFWQQMLEKLFNWSTGAEPSNVQQVIGLLVILIGVWLIFPKKGYD